MPAAVRWLGGTGALPFAIATAAIWLAPEPLRAFAATAIAIYAAVILSFLGGIAWGATCATAADAPLTPDHAELLTVSIIPALVGWAAALLPAGYGLVIMAISFVAVLLIDRRLATLRMVPPWWMTLRRRLSLTVAALLLLAAAGISLKS